MTSPIRPHSTISVTANAKRHRGASGTLLPGAVSRESAALTSLFILSPFRPLSINTCVHHPCIPGPDHKQAGSGKSAPVSSTNVTSSDRLRQCPFPETSPDSPPLRAPCDNKEPSPEQEVRGVSPGSGNSSAAIAKPAATISTLPAAQDAGDLRYIDHTSENTPVSRPVPSPCTVSEP